MIKAFALAAALAAASPALAAELQIEIAGEANGTVTVDLFDDVAPQHAERLETLAKEGAYDGVVFHRVIDGFMAQTGDVKFGRLGDGLDMRRAGQGGSDLPNLPAEFSDIPFDRGVIGMARAGDPKCGGAPGCKERGEFLNSANSQFFIMFSPAPFLNGNYTVVGKVTGGMDVVDKIKRGTVPNGAVVGEPDHIVSIKVIE
ncbi:MAG: peptidylprolyl isomerase [Rhodobacteraceae bacterium]|nr:peptidylprolyl isomerase [Paracoccaceae bacterium]